MIWVADYSVIADVGLSLVNLLKKALVPDLISHVDGVGLANPLEKGDMNLTVYLYDIKENSDARNNEMVDLGSRLKYPGMALDLYYLITAHSSSDVLTRGIDEQRILGKTMQLLHDNPMLKEEDLEGSLIASETKIRISKEAFPFETLITLFPNQPYKLSLAYRVGPVVLDSTRTREVSRVTERQLRMNQKQ